MDIIAENKIRESKEYQELEKSISLFNRFAWGLVIIGAFALAAGLGSIIGGEYAWIQAAGDFSGGLVASFWSLAGIMFVYIAFLGQRQQLMLQEEELRLSREELAATREELKGQREQLEEQSKTAALQRFESTYFTLVANLMDRIRNLRIEKSNATGQQIYSRFHRHLVESFRNSQRNKNQELIENIRIVFDKVRQTRSKEIKGDDAVLLFNEIYLTLDFIQKSILSKREKAFYYDLLFAKFSSSTISVLLYHSFLEEFKEQRKYIVYFTNGGIDYPLSQYLIDESHRSLFKLSSEELDLLKI